ncbi:MAG: hypothetical protein IH955_09100 [Chloroflexi bacterium]|nr:hypothetical protein [Chloroflexota bacterium]
MRYIVQIDLDPETGADLEAHPERIQEFMGKWQAHNPVGMYFSLTRRRVTVVLDAPNEDSFFEALHASWVVAKSYPEVWPVVNAEDFPAIMKRVGMV